MPQTALPCCNRRVIVPGHGDSFYSEVKSSPLFLLPGQIPTRLLTVIWFQPLPPLHPIAAWRSESGNRAARASKHASQQPVPTLHVSQRCFLCCCCCCPGEVSPGAPPGQLLTNLDPSHNPLRQTLGKGTRVGDTGSSPCSRSGRAGI